MVLDAVVGVETRIPASARTAAILGTKREGSGVVIDANGLVLTIGYLIIEAESADIVTADGERVPGQIVAFDYASGFGLLRAAKPLGIAPLAFGNSAALKEGAPILIAAADIAAADTTTEKVKAAYVVSRREFAGYWEYLLDNAIFTAPPHFKYAGAALIGPKGRLLGIGSLLVSDTQGKGSLSPGNMFVPIERLKPILASLVATGRSPEPPTPWLGVITEVVRGRLFISSVRPGGPAAASGLRAGDIILEVAGSPVVGLADFYRKVWSQGEAGVAVPVTVLHGAAPRIVVIDSGNRAEFLRARP